MDFRHVSVMAAEVVAFLAPARGQLLVDGTLGGGGHTELLLQATAPDGVVVGFDRDRDALAAAGRRLESYGNRLRLVHANFADLRIELLRLGIERIDGFLLDLGVSSYQLDSPERGFSFSKEAPLDMRMNTASGPSAADLVNELSLDELTGIIRAFGEERWARRIASRIVEARSRRPIETTTELADIVRRAIPAAKREERIDPATRTFQALRIAVNEELESLRRGLKEGISLLVRGGRGVVISFHSLEDRIVKEAFREGARGCICPKSVPLCVCRNVPQLKVLTPKPVKASEAEISENPRSRSARLRAAQKVV